MTMQQTIHLQQHLSTLCLVESHIYCKVSVINTCVLSDKVLFNRNMKSIHVSVTMLIASSLLCLTMETEQPSQTA